MTDQPASAIYLRALFDQLELGVMIADDEARYLEVNRTACALLGRARDELVGKIVYDLVEESRRGAIRGQWEAFLRDGTQSGVFVAILPDGTEREVAFNARAHFLPGLHCSFLTEVASPRPGPEEKLGTVTMCAWTKRIKQGEAWVPLEEFLASEYGLRITHGICPEAVKRFDPDAPES